VALEAALEAREEELNALQVSLSPGNPGGNPVGNPGFFELKCNGNSWIPPPLLDGAVSAVSSGGLSDYSTYVHIW